MFSETGAEPILFWLYSNAITDCGRNQKTILACILGICRLMLERSGYAGTIFRNQNIIIIIQKFLICIKASVIIRNLIHNTFKTKLKQTKKMHLIFYTKIVVNTIYNETVSSAKV